jgi:hypothetical protein
VVSSAGGVVMVVAAYDPEIEGRMRDYFESLNEKDRRRYAGLEASKLGHGGVIYISEILGCDRKTVRKGLDEILDPSGLDPGRIRKKGRQEKLS